MVYSNLSPFSTHVTDLLLIAANMRSVGDTFDECLMTQLFFNFVHHFKHLRQSQNIHPDDCFLLIVA